MNIDTEQVLAEIREATMLIGQCKYCEYHETDGEYWEIWYLSGAWAATGELEGKDHKAIMEYLCQMVNPGQIIVSGEHWGLGVD